MLISSILLSLSTPEHPDTLNCAEIVDDDLATMCARDRLTESSAALKSEYVKMLELMNRIDEDGQPVGFVSDITATEEFGRAHGNWLNYRDFHCYFEGRLSKGALRIPSTILLCRARMNWEKTDQFRDYQIMARDHK
ncbi:DUF1311 domain-containing protein [Altererythrobacter luteolus]|uniref:DUF1311 domain-containing protein n=1 Tax=Pontixanthobacter luteolus TaxID=295089 RepID=A0A6I4V0Q8_9SPHN|nr:lysozyme inhibitor LprI family protein [Pontixanthobacter luteolus]MXP46841.1 DUF1311 domain-containing protein [Pontixanthobacter luteolus]